MKLVVVSWDDPQEIRNPDHHDYARLFPKQTMGELAYEDKDVVAVSHEKNRDTGEDESITVISKKLVVARYECELNTGKELNYPGRSRPIPRRISGGSSSKRGKRVQAGSSDRPRGFH